MQDDLDGLLDRTLSMAGQMLRESGEFYPFSATVALDGDFAVAMAGPESEGVPSVAASMREEGLAPGVWRRSFSAWRDPLELPICQATPASTWRARRWCLNEPTSRSPAC